MPENLTSHLDQNTTIVVAINAWEMYLADQGRSPNTIKAFRSDVRLLVNFLPDDTTLSKATTKELARFFDWMENEREVACSPKTLARRITSVKSLFRWLHQFGAIVVDPAEKIAQRSVISPVPMVLTREEYERALLAADRRRRAAKPDARLYTLAYLLLSTGVKKSETLGIEIEHLELDAPGEPRVFIKYASPANRYKERKITLPQDWLPAYEEYLAQYKPETKLFPWSPRRLEYLLEDLSAEAGLTKRISFDMCRWTCALNDYRAGMEPDAIRQKLGVSKIQWRELFNKLRILAEKEE
ncbi:MAG: site-specific integrase [Anaerolineales bacterium]|nr:site-specific integrase [Anaerolineales bacterium]MCL4260762.1 site-specific integrase [Anaerolineales bacterium]